MKDTALAVLLSAGLGLTPAGWGAESWDTVVALVILLAISRAGENADIFAGARPRVSARHTSPKTPRAQLSGSSSTNKEES